MASAREILAMKHAAPMYANAAPRIIQRIKGQLIINPEYEKYIDEIALVLAQTFAGKEKEIADNMARIYCTEFNEQDIAELVTFYKSHARASRDWGHQWAVLFAATVSSQFRDEMRKRGQEIWCARFAPIAGNEQRLARLLLEEMEIRRIQLESVLRDKLAMNGGDPDDQWRTRYGLCHANACFSASDMGAASFYSADWARPELNSPDQRSVVRYWYERTMNGDTRDLVSALLAMGYAAVLLVLGELYITGRSTDLPAISLKQSGSVSQALHAIAAY
jgi:uncharacterized protein